MTGICQCCGQPGINLASCNTIHGDCWIEHHSDPTDPHDCEWETP